MAQWESELPDPLWGNDGNKAIDISGKKQPKDKTAKKKKKKKGKKKDQG